MTKEPTKPSQVPDGHLWTIEPPRIEAMITGAIKAGFRNDGRVVLVYEDGTKEEAKLPIAEADKLAGEGFFKIVSTIQSLRKTKEAATFSKVCRMMQFGEEA